MNLHGNRVSQAIESDGVNPYIVYLLRSTIGLGYLDRNEGRIKPDIT